MMLGFIDSIANVLVFLVVALGIGLAGTAKAFFSERREKRRTELELEAERRRGALAEKVRGAMDKAAQAGQQKEREAIERARDGRRDHFESER